MQTEVRCKICGARLIENGVPRAQVWMIAHVRKFHPHVVLLDDIMDLDKDYWKRTTREGYVDAAQSEARDLDTTHNNESAVG